MPAPSRKSVALSLLLIGVGVILGLVVASDLGWLPFGHAVPDAPTATKPAAVAPPAAGSDRNFVEVAKAVTPTVVNISTTRISRLPEGHAGAAPFDDPSFKRFFGDELFRRFEAPKDRRERSLGSGVIVDANGYIITNNHVVSKADEIRILFSDKRSLTAKVVGTDPKTDIAVIKVDAKDLPTIPWADSDKLQVGEYVLAIGNPFGLNQTVTMGIVSAVGRANVGIAEYEDFIQTDAAINPGNSGGALVNARGELIGINTAIFSQSGGYMGIGFAVPSNMVRSVMDQLIKGGKVVRGYLGVSIQELTSDLARQFGVAETRGVLISDVLADSPAKRAKLERGDVIVEFDGRAVENPTQFRNLVAQTPIGKKVRVKFLRGGKERDLEVTIAEQPKTIAQSESPGDEGGEARVSGAFAGMDVRELTPELARRFNLPRADKGGVIVARIAEGSPAGEAGLQGGDLITEINRKPIAN
ncbi:MAG: DegQ family serine endoprotease, partial [Nitrospirales bacterium]|nr:DegQ family serine endoprotease [Nitrospirales bacterium]